MERNVTNLARLGARRRPPSRRGRHAAAGLTRGSAAGEHVDASGPCRCCGAPSPCSVACRRDAGARELFEPVGPALGATPGAGLTLQLRDLRTEESTSTVTTAAVTIPATPAIQGSRATRDTGRQLTLRAVDVRGRAVAIEVAVRRETVELWCAEGRRSVLDRGAARRWLSHPGTELAADDVTLACTESGAVVLSVVGALDRWTLTPQALDALRERL